MIQNATGRGRAPADAKKLGFWLRRHKGRFVERHRFLNNVSARGKKTSWWVDGQDNEQTEGLWKGFTDEEEPDLHTRRTWRTSL